MESFIGILSVLGAFFAVLLVLAVSVETILDLFKLTGLLRARISPEQTMKDIAGWISDDKEIQSKSKVMAINNLLQEFKVKSDKITAQANILKDFATESSGILGVKEALNDAEQKFIVKLAAIRKEYELHEGRRVALLRVLSAGIGITIAFVLAIDAIQLLSDILPTKLRTFVNDPKYLSSWLSYGGIALTGFAASAGSSFWHDQLDRVRALKESVRKAAQALEPD